MIASCDLPALGHVTFCLKEETEPKAPHHLSLAVMHPAQKDAARILVRSRFASDFIEPGTQLCAALHLVNALGTPNAPALIAKLEALCPSFTHWAPVDHVRLLWDELGTPLGLSCPNGATRKRARRETVFTLSRALDQVSMTHLPLSPASQVVALLGRVFSHHPYASSPGLYADIPRLIEEIHCPPPPPPKVSTAFMARRAAQLQDEGVVG